MRESLLSYDKPQASIKRASTRHYVYRVTFFLPVRLIGHITFSFISLMLQPAMTRDFARAAASELIGASASPTACGKDGGSA